MAFANVYMLAQQVITAALKNVEKKEQNLDFDYFGII
jgi:hypothetical protein